MENVNQEQQTTEPPRMKILQLTQMNLAAVGVNRNLSLQSYPIDMKIIIGFLILGLFFTFTLMYTIFEAKTFNEYTQSSFMVAVATLVILEFAIVVLNVKKLLQAINNCENLIKTSECMRRIHLSIPEFD